MTQTNAGMGRYAPSPTGDLHLGNLRTAMLAWLFARRSGRAFGLRVEDLDRTRIEFDAQQQADLAAIGITFDGDPVYSSSLVPHHEDAVRRLIDAGLTYECYCSRREIAEAASAPHGEPMPDGAYPGTCRNLTEAERERRRVERPAALRLRSEVPEWTVRDDLHGDYTALVDDFVLRRNDGVIAYNLTVVVDDAHTGVDQVVRGDDLLSSSPRQAYLQHLLGLPGVSYAHVPLVLGAEGKRLAKRDGAITLAQVREAYGLDAGGVRTLLASSLGLAESGESVTMQTLLDRFSPESVPRGAWTFLS